MRGQKVQEKVASWTSLVHLTAAIAADERHCRARALSPLSLFLQRSNVGRNGRQCGPLGYAEAAQRKAAQSALEGQATGVESECG